MSMAFSRYRYGHRGENNACEVPGRHGLLLSIQSSFSAWSMSGLPSAGCASSIVSRASFKAAEHIDEILEAMAAYNRGLSFEDIHRCR
jgi:hypothetical protein